MKLKSSIQAIKEVERLVCQHCDYIMTKDALRNGHMQLPQDKRPTLYTKRFIIWDRVGLIELSLTFEPRDGIGRIDIKNGNIFLLYKQIPVLRHRIHEIRMNNGTHA